MIVYDVYFYEDDCFLACAFVNIFILYANYVNQALLEEHAPLCNACDIMSMKRPVGVGTLSCSSNSFSSRLFLLQILNNFMVCCNLYYVFGLTVKVGL